MKRTLIVCICLAVLPHFAHPAAAEDLDSQRQRFVKAYRALTTGQTTQARSLISGLEHYPLYVYFRYYELSRSLHKQSNQTVREFLAAYDGSLLADRLRTEWLKLLSRGNRWADLVLDYRAQSDVKLQCLYLKARIETGELEGVVAEARRLWLVGKSQPEECNPAFEFLSRQKILDDTHLWQRMRLAFENNNSGLARYLARSLSNPALRTASERWLAAHTDPGAALNHAYFNHDSELSREIAVYALARLAAANVDRADNMWQRIRDQFAFSAAQVGEIQRSLAIAAGRQDHPARLEYLDRVPPEAVDDAVEKYRIREGLKANAWEKLARWTETGPVGETNDLRWRYWHARALEKTGHPADAESIFRELAGLRDYYGFLSADRLGLDYQMNDLPTAPTEIEADDIETRPAIVRARELFAIGMPYDARREWAHEINQLSKRELEVAAHVVYRWGWYDRAIIALGKAESYDDLEIRFPLRYETLVREYANKRGIAPAVLYSIIRTESAFMDDARSPAGALGLMQVMPETGRDVARRIGAKLPSANGLLDPEKNIMIGSAYLKHVLSRFEDSFSMAAAAYNAGPRRVNAWLPKSGCVPADIWIDTIPFTETRRYVRRASFYATVYEWRLKETIERLNTRLSDVNANGVKQQC